MRQWQISRWIRDRDAWTIIGTSDKTFAVYRNAHPIAESNSLSELEAKFGNLPGSLMNELSAELMRAKTHLDLYDLEKRLSENGLCFRMKRDSFKVTEITPMDGDAVMVQTEAGGPKSVCSVNNLFRLVMVSA